MADQNRYDYPTVIAGLVGLWLNCLKRALLAQGKDYAREFHEKLALARTSIQEAFEASADLDLEVVGLRLCLRPSGRGYLLELSFRDDSTAHYFFERISVFKYYQREEIPVEFPDNLNMLLAMLLNEAPMRIEGARISIELPLERKFFAESNPFLREAAEHPHAPA